MTSTELAEAIRSFGAGVPIALKDLGIVAWSRGDDDDWIDTAEAGECVRLGIRVYNNAHNILLKGHKVNNIGNEEAIQLFESFAEVVSRSYGGFDVPTAGIDAVRWEDSDPWIDSIFVMEPKTV